MSLILSNNLGGSTLEGLQITSDVEFYRSAANVLHTPDSLSIDSDIYQDDVVYPYLLVGGTQQSRTFTIKVRKFDGNDSANTRHQVHWWTSTSSWGAPSILTGGSGISIAITTGTNHGTVSGSALNTSWTDSNETIVITVTTSNTSGSSTLYFHAEVQGIAYQTSGTVYTVASSA
jgi:hypothetical protein